MDTDQKTEQRRVVVDTPGVRREIVTERTEKGPSESGVSNGTIALVAVLAVIAIGTVLYLVINRNENESANRNANLDIAAREQQQQPTTVVQQPATQPPVIIQQPATQQAPVIIQQPAQPNPRDTTGDDANMQEVAAKRLTDEPGMASVSVSISGAQAFLTGSVISAATRAKAERLVKEVPGVKSVDNKIVVTSG